MATAVQAGTGPQAGDPALPPGLFRYVWQEGRAQQVWLCLLAAGVVPLLQRAVNRRAKRKVELMRELGELIVEPRDDRGKRYRERLDRIYRVRLQYYALKFLIKFLNNLLNHLASLSVLMVGGYLVTTGATTVGTVVAFISGFQRLADPSRELLAYYRLAAETAVQYGLMARRLTA